MTPAPPHQPAAAEPAAAATGTAQVLARLVSPAVALLAGLALLILPWTTAWEHNYFANLGPQWKELWLSPYLRGAVTGLGAANFYIALAELVSLRRPLRTR